MRSPKVDGSSLRSRRNLPTCARWPVWNVDRRRQENPFVPSAVVVKQELPRPPCRNIARHHMQRQRANADVQLDQPSHLFEDGRRPDDPFTNAQTAAKTGHTFQRVPFTVSLERRGGQSVQVVVGQVGLGLVTAAKQRMRTAAEQTELLRNEGSAGKRWPVPFQRLPVGPPPAPAPRGWPARPGPQWRRDGRHKTGPPPYRISG